MLLSTQSQMLYKIYTTFEYVIHIYFRIDLYVLMDIGLFFLTYIISYHSTNCNYF